MEVRQADTSDAPIIHELMIKAFSAYKDEVPPSSALEETVDSISSALMGEEQAFIAYDDEQPVAMVRCKMVGEGLYFFRLSVLPEKQGQGIAKSLLRYLETYAQSHGIPKILCNVRKTLPKNIRLYESVGYRVVDEEVVLKPSGVSLSVVRMEKLVER